MAHSHLGFKIVSLFPAMAKLSTNCSHPKTIPPSLKPLSVKPICSVHTGLQTLPMFSSSHPFHSSPSPVTCSAGSSDSAAPEEPCIPPQLQHLMDCYFSESLSVEDRLLNFYSFGADGRLSKFFFDLHFRRVTKVQGHKVYIAVHLAQEGTVRVEGFADSKRMMSVVQIFTVGFSGLTKRELQDIPAGFLKKMLNIGFPEAFYTDAEVIVQFIQYMTFEFI